VLFSEFEEKQNLRPKKTTVFDNSVGEWTTVDKLATGIEIQTLFAFERGQVKDLVQQNPSPCSHTTLQHATDNLERQKPQSQSPSK
jgi:hypothetical protein